ncbi:MAG: ABC transporter substrate-binding protein [Propionibacteriaceae bacterium]|nr:ABC transporter substrate-binding protein [Propionibacteriaceae bacterium]
MDETRVLRTEQEQRMRRRTLLGGLGAALLLAGCSIAPAGTGAPTGASQAGANQSAAAGEAGGTIRVGVNSMPPGLGNPFTGIGAQSVYTWSAIFDPLVMVDNKGVPQPWLASSWRNVDPMTWEFDLRPDVKFSDGTPFDAEAVKATVDFLVSEAGAASVVGSEMSMLQAATAVDSDTVRITTKRPEASFPARMSAVYIVSPTAWSSLGPEGFAAKPVGTGPFVIESINAERASADAFTDSWRKPQAERIEWTKLADAPSRLQALPSKQLDMAISLPPDQRADIESSGETLNVQSAPQVMAWALTQTIGGDKPVKNPKVRLALNHAIDRQAISDSIMAGLARPATQGSTEGTFGYNPEIKGYDYDPAKAKELLAEAGYPDGFSMTATVTVGSFPGDGDIYQAVAAYLSEVGVNVSFETVQFSQWLERYQQNTWTTDAFNQSWNVAPTGDAIRPAMIFSCLKAKPFVCDESLTPLIEQSNAEFDVDKRRALLQEMATKYYDNPPSLLLIEQVDIVATGAAVRGFEMTSRFIAYDKITVR